MASVIVLLQRKEAVQEVFARTIYLANTNVLMQAKRIHTCVAPGCKKRPSFGQAKASATRCSQHKISGDVDVVNLMCKAMGCTRGAIFGGPDTAWSRTFCKRHCSTSHVNLAYLRPWNLTVAALRNSSCIMPHSLALHLSQKPRQGNEVVYGCSEQQAYDSAAGDRRVPSVTLPSMTLPSMMLALAGPSEQASSFETWWVQAGVLCMPPTMATQQSVSKQRDVGVAHEDKPFEDKPFGSSAASPPRAGVPSLLTGSVAASNSMWGGDKIPDFLGAWLPPSSPGAVPRTPGGSLDKSALGLDLAPLAPPPFSLDTTFGSEGWTAESGVLIQSSPMCAKAEAHHVLHPPSPGPKSGASSFSRGLCEEQVGTNTSHEEQPEIAAARQETRAAYTQCVVLDAHQAARVETAGKKCRKGRKAHDAAAHGPRPANTLVEAAKIMGHMLYTVPAFCSSQSSSAANANGERGGEQETGLRRKLQKIDIRRAAEPKLGKARPLANGLALDAAPCSHAHTHTHTHTHTHMEQPSNLHSTHTGDPTKAHAPHTPAEGEMCQQIPRISGAHESVQLKIQGASEGGVGREVAVGMEECESREDKEDKEEEDKDTSHIWPPICEICNCHNAVWGCEVFLIPYIHMLRSGWGGSRGGGDRNCL